MKKILFLLLIALAIVACESEEKVKSDLDKLKTERQSLTYEINDLKSVKANTENQISTLQEKVRELGIYKSGRTPHYMMKFKLKQSHFSLDPGKHIKDAMNAIEFEMPVSKEFYEQTAIGTEIVDEFREGSFWMEGSFGNWHMTVIEKYVR